MLKFLLIPACFAILHGNMVYYPKYSTLQIILLYVTCNGNYSVL